jgi:uncharacterized protein DUF3616
MPKPDEIKIIKPIPFNDRPQGEDCFNASGIVALEDSTFLFCDNHIPDALFELHIIGPKKKKHSIKRRSFKGIELKNANDFEGLALAEEGKQKFVFATTSLSMNKRSALVRITIGKKDKAEIIPDFRSWLTENVPELRKASKYSAEKGGINVEGLCWYAKKNLLMMGFRTPLIKGRPFILPIHLQKPSCSWSVENLKILPPIILTVKNDQGIRTLSYDSRRKEFFVVVGNSTSSSKSPFHLYSWNGNTKGAVHHIDNVRFHRKMKVEGMTYGTIKGRGALIFVDDGGGYQILWDDDPRLA